MEVGVPNGLGQEVAEAIARNVLVEQETLRQLTQQVVYRRCVRRRVHGRGHCTAVTAGADVGIKKSQALLCRTMVNYGRPCS